MSKTLAGIEVEYFHSLRTGDVNRALRNNCLYYSKLFDLYQTLNDEEDKIEIAQELNYLVEQARYLKQIQLNDRKENE